MTPEPLQVVNRFRDAVNAADSVTMRACLAEDVEWEHEEDPLAGEPVLEAAGRK